MATLKKTQNGFCLMQVKSIAECSKGGAFFRNTFNLHLRLPFVAKIIVLSIFEWPFYTGFIVNCTMTAQLLDMLSCDGVLHSFQQSFSHIMIASYHNSISGPAALERFIST